MDFDLVELREFMVNNFQIIPDKICLCNDLKSDLGLEIWDRIELIIFFETKYKVKFPDDASSRFETLFEMIAFVVLESYHLPPTLVR